jgi:hypothetical protein
MDFKPTVLLIGTLLIDVNEIAKTSALILNVAYIGYQFYILHKKSKDDKN